MVKIREITTTRPLTTAESRARERVLRTVNKLYDLLDSQKEVETTAKEIADSIEESYKATSEVLTLMRKHALLEMRIIPHGQGHVSVYYTLVAPQETAIAVINKLISNGVNKALQEMRNNQITRPLTEMSVGSENTQSPFAPLRVLTNEPQALVEAAKQYVSQREIAEQHLVALRGAGLKIDPQAYYASIELPKDERFETIALILPYIISLETECAKLSEGQRRLNLNHPSTQQYLDTIERLHKENEKLSARLEELTANQMQEMTEEKVTDEVH